MTGRVFAVGPCWACGRVFPFDPDLVPSIHGDPLCSSCVARANELRAGTGAPKIVVYPGTYPDE